jgi:hypothetical protein
MLNNCGYSGKVADELWKWYDFSEKKRRCQLLKAPNQLLFLISVSSNRVPNGLNGESFLNDEILR